VVESPTTNDLRMSLQARENCDLAVWLLPFPVIVLGGADCTLSSERSRNFPT